MNQLATYTTFVEQQLAAHAFPNTPENLYDPLRYFLKIGGKRMRPILTLMAAEAVSASPNESIAAALSVELFHNFSLIHDDIMDNAPVRRSFQTVHEKWNPNIAILSGDVLLVEAYKQLAFYSDDRLPLLFKRFNDTAVEVCEGQQMDMDFEERANVSVNEYIEMIRLKTSVLLGCALEFGVIVGRGDEQLRKLFYDFGVQLGLAFQIQDDYLDLYADPEKFGKQVGGDVLSNKKTMLSLLARDCCNKSKDPRYQELLDMPPTAEKVVFAKNLFHELKVADQVLAEMNVHFDKAMQDLEKMELSESSKKPFKELADFLINREH
jgi:geranylgeranyl diphosphate synthase type II